MMKAAPGLLLLAFSCAPPVGPWHPPRLARGHVLSREQPAHLSAEVRPHEFVPLLVREPGWCPLPKPGDIFLAPSGELVLGSCGRSYACSGLSER